MRLRHSLSGASGISIVDTVVAMAIIATIAAVSAPTVVNVIDSARLGMSVRDVERELQFARLKAVATNRPMRVRFDCPATGTVRVVELIGTPMLPNSSDAESNPTRCSESAYPYSPTGPDQSRLTRPNNDGPIRWLHPGVSFTAKRTLEFWPDGSVHGGGVAGNPWPILGSAGTTITLTRKGVSRNIKVNARGKIQMDR